MSDHHRLVDRAWTCTAIDGTPVDLGAVPRGAPHLTFGDDGGLSGFAGVNRVMGRWRVDDGVLAIDGPATTMMAGPPEVMELEQRFLRALGAGGALRQDGDELAIADRLSFVAEPIEPAATATLAHRTLDGSVVYRERIAMPPGAVITVQLLDVSRQDVAADVLAEAVIERPGNVPVPFTLSYDPATIEPRHSYAVSARITVDGELWWITADRHTVLADDSPAHVDVRLQRVDRRPDS